jgi:hypothetical protein
LARLAKDVLRRLGVLAPEAIQLPAGRIKLVTRKIADGSWVVL